MVERRNWDKFEVALLVDGCQKVLDGIYGKTAVEVSLSNNMREFASIYGFTVDKEYRNLNGIHWQMGIMLQIMRTKDLNSKAVYMGHSKLFLKMVALSRNNPPEFKAILGIAKLLYSCKNVPYYGFIEYFENKYDSKKALGLFEAMLELSEKSIRSGYAFMPLLQIKDLGQLKKVYKLLETYDLDEADMTSKLLFFADYIQYVDDVLRNKETERTVDTKISNQDESCEKIVSVTNMDDLYEKVDKAFIEAFPHGIKKGFPGIKSKLNRTYQVLFSKSLEDEDFDFDSYLSEHVQESNQILYVISDEIKIYIKKFVERYISEGSGIVFYDKLYEYERDWLLSRNIYSSEQLMKIVADIFPNYFYSKNYFSIKGKIDFKELVYNVTKGKYIVTIDIIQSELPDISSDYIEKVLVGNDYSWVRIGEYILTEKIEFDSVEVFSVLECIKKNIEKVGFCSLVSQTFDKSLELNDNLSVYALRDAFCKKYISSSEYYKNGNLLFNKDKHLSISSILMDYCRNNEVLTLDNLVSVEKELTGTWNRRLLEYAYLEKIRISKDTFISSDEIRFDVAGVDSALDLFVADNVIPVKSVTSFLSFPSLNNYSWNLYILESFCVKFSSKYRYKCLNYNSDHIGIICPVYMKDKSYEELLAHAVVRAQVPLTKEDVGVFLAANGYIMRRTKLVKDVITVAQKIGYMEVE